MTGYLFLAIVMLMAVGYVLGRLNARAVGADARTHLHSRPTYHGFFVALWTGVPALLLLLVWLLAQSSVIDWFLIRTLPEDVVSGLSSQQINLLISEVRQVAAGRIFQEPAIHIEQAAAALNRWQVTADWAFVAVLAALTLTGMVWARTRISAAYRSRHRVETFMTVFMIVCSLIAIITTLGIVSSLVYEAFQFFRLVPVTEFFFGLNWEPQIAMRADQVAGAGAFGAIPVFLGTIVIAFLAMLLAVPVGLFSAIYLTEYASERFRAVVKPVLEILAGVPTVVYGFFAVLTVAPRIRNLGAMVGLDVSPNSAVAAGGVMGIMLIPFISSLSDDALAAVPRSMREGSFGLGATKSETIMRVLIPAALPGIVGGVLLALSRAIGETMIVVMAAGLIARMTVNPFEAVTTVTVQIVTLLIGDSEFDNPKTLAAFALGLVLFLVTLGLNVVALSVVRKYRERYE